MTHASLRLGFALGVIVLEVACGRINFENIATPPDSSVQSDGSVDPDAVAISCSDSIHNGNESDVDCGGDLCGPCADNSGCEENADCMSEVCTGSICQAASCTDNVHNQDETDIDCGGGLCGPCADGSDCDESADCLSEVCTGSICQAASCTDNVHNQDETDIDCGGNVCGNCGNGLHCNSGADCISGLCISAVCVSAGCADGMLNQDETDIDCGGTICEPCDVNDTCDVDSDCISDSCTSHSCDPIDELYVVDLNGDNGYAAIPTATSGRFGESVACGDFNHDDFGDPLFGASVENSSGHPNAGRVYMQFGEASFSATENLIAQGFIFNGGDDDGRAGDALGVSDANGDGIDDILIQAPKPPNDAGYHIPGRLNWSSISNPIDLGSPEVVDGTVFRAPYSSGRWAQSMRSAGDVNNDGREDIVIGTSTAGNPSESGRAYVVFGSTNFESSSPIAVDSLNGANGFTVIGDNGDRLGTTVGPAGDINNDGYDDVLMGAIETYAPVGHGKVHLIFGGPSFSAMVDPATFNGSNGVTFEDSTIPNNSELGSGLSATTADINNDGYDDILIGADKAGPKSNGGRVYLVFGKATWTSGSFDLATLNGTNGVIFIAGKTELLVGRSLDFAEDINGDNIEDIVIGAPHLSNASPGRVYVVYGRINWGFTTWDLDLINGTNGIEILAPNGSKIGSAVATCDVNNDGYSDIVTGDYRFNSFQGLGYVIFGFEQTP